MKNEYIIEGMTIISKYYNKDNNYNVGAEHDILYLFETDKPVSKEDLKTLIDLGWTQEEADFVDETFTIAAYDQGLSWSAYV